METSPPLIHQNMKENNFEMILIAIDILNRTISDLEYLSNSVPTDKKALIQADRDALTDSVTTLKRLLVRSVRNSGELSKLRGELETVVEFLNKEHKVIDFVTFKANKDNDKRDI